MLTLKASVVATILVGAMAATAGATYIATRASATVSCSAPPSAESRPELPAGTVPAYKGKQW